MTYKDGIYRKTSKPELVNYAVAGEFCYYKNGQGAMHLAKYNNSFATYDIGMPHYISYGPNGKIFAQNNCNSQKLFEKRMAKIIAEEPRLKPYCDCMIKSEKKMLSAYTCAQKLNKK